MFVIIVNSLLKHINGPGTFKIDHVQVKAHPGPTTETIISKVFVKIQVLLLFFSGTNDLTNDINTMGRTVKEIK